MYAADLLIVHLQLLLNHTCPLISPSFMMVLFWNLTSLQATPCTKLNASGFATD